MKDVVSFLELTLERSEKAGFENHRQSRLMPLVPEKTPEERRLGR